ncbi:PE-PGRS family protein PE_PGRS16 [Folsomia candida]|uniref:Uncharacterized protein n=1 Tax=Folsomia candida TaxID=158441 RepID=A0A226DC35_FOLCA|nr:PE-PGRS family protein PE_PGRS16 [Folsomia candida]OXA41806.1 hypothetical protein Fcan01_23465 [Folsomia candida]
MGNPTIILFFGILLLANFAKCEDAAATGAAGAAATSSSNTGTAPVAGLTAPPPPHPGGPGGIGPGGIPGGLGGLFPGLGFGGLGFNKHLDFNAGAGYGPFLGGLGGFGGGVPPPPPVDAGIDPGLGGGFGGLPFGLLGPSYIPSTWIGSALGAKGDLLFPLVMFVFFVVGVWTIVQFLLGLIVPLIAAKVSILKGGLNNKFSRRSLTPQEEKDEQITHLTNVVWAAFENFGCMKTSACYTGNMVHSLAGTDNLKQYEGILDTMKIMDKDIVAIFKKSVESGQEDCSKYPCDAFGKNAEHQKGDSE